MLPVVHVKLKSEFECIKSFDCQSRVHCLTLIPNRPDELVSGLGSGVILVWDMK